MAKINYNNVRCRITDILKDYPETMTFKEAKIVTARILSQCTRDFARQLYRHSGVTKLDGRETDTFRIATYRHTFAEFEITDYEEEIK